MEQDELARVKLLKILKNEYKSYIMIDFKDFSWVNGCKFQNGIIFPYIKKKLTSRHNICPIEVKSNKNYMLTSLRKCIAKYNKQIHISNVIHPQDLKN